MVFSDVSGNLGIVQDTHFWCGSDSDGYATTDITRNVNNWYAKVVTWIMESTPGWTWDDANSTTHADVSTTLVNAQAQYVIPTTALKIDKVFILDADGEYYEVPLKPFDLDEDFSDWETGKPETAYLRGNAIYLNPTPDTTQVTAAAGLLLYVERQPTYFVAADTTDEPGFPAQFHRILSLGAAYDFWLGKDPQRADRLLRDINGLKNELQEYFSGRNRQDGPKLRRKWSTSNFV